MTYSRLLACFAAAGLLAACSDQMETSVAEVADEAPQAMDAGANDGGIPLSSSSKSSITQYKKIRKLADKGDFILANQAARQLTEEEPEFVGGWIMLGNTALSGEQFAKATAKAKELSVKGTEGEGRFAQTSWPSLPRPAHELMRLLRVPWQVEKL